MYLECREKFRGVHGVARMKARQTLQNHPVHRAKARERERGHRDIGIMESNRSITDKKQHTRLGNIFNSQSFSRPVFLYSSIAKKGCFLIGAEGDEAASERIIRQADDSLRYLN